MKQQFPRLGVPTVPLALPMAPGVIERIAAHADTAWMAIGAGRDAPDVRDVQLPDVVMRTVPAPVGEAGPGGGDASPAPTPGPRPPGGPGGGRAAGPGSSRSCRSRTSSASSNLATRS